MKQFVVVGVDVSKKTLDFCFKPLGSMMCIDNNCSGYRRWYQELRKLMDSETKVIVIMEHTGGYSTRFEQFLKAKNVEFCKIAALQIKRSIGMTRGKNDRVDSVRIAEYGWLRKEQLQCDEPCSEQIDKLKTLLSFRDKIVKDRSGYACRLKELKVARDYKNSDALIKSHQIIIDCLTTEIKKAELQILSLINEDPQLKKTYELIRTVKGVGPVVAAFMIGCTNNFKRFSNARKFNCYAGLAPFKHESGTSIRGRSRLSHLANRTAKTLLTLAASTAIQWDEELKKYYKHRVSEGMRKMSCLNIIRSKIVARIFAVAKRQTPFVRLDLAA